jgi:hypothetical protein
MALRGFGGYHGWARGTDSAIAGHDRGEPNPFKLQF